MSNRLLAPSLIRLDVAFGDTRNDVIAHLAGMVAATGRASSDLLLSQDFQAREEVSPTGVAGGAAVPHCRSAVVRKPTMAFARLADPVKFGGPGGPADLVLPTAVPEDSGRTYLEILSKLARGLLRPEFLHQLRTATVGSSVGLHARPAALIAEAAAGFAAEIWLELADAPAADPSQADSSLVIMALGAARGDRVKISSAGPAAVAEIAALIAADLNS